MKDIKTISFTAVNASTTFMPLIAFLEAEALSKNVTEYKKLKEGID